jgi:hypothetical protein
MMKNKLGPGITLDGLLEYSRYKSNDPAGPDYQGIGVGSAPRSPSDADERRCACRPGCGICRRLPHIAAA